MKGPLPGRPLPSPSDDPHVPVLIEAIVRECAPVAGVWLDGTLGAGGYTRELLKAGADRVIGLDRLRALHLNDSKNPCGSHKDRHEQIGKGFLGIETFRRIVNHPALRGLPMFLETPNDLSGYQEEIALLRSLEQTSK